MKKLISSLLYILLISSISSTQANDVEALSPLQKVVALQYAKNKKIVPSIDEHEGFI